MFKYFTTRFGTDPITTLMELRKEFPTMQFRSGVRKGTKGIWVIKDVEFKDEYGTPWETDKGDFFYPPHQSFLNKIKETLSDYKTDVFERLPVKLRCGIILDIFPASCIPRKALFSRRMKKQELTEEEIYNKAHPYGAKAYELYFRSLTNKEIKLDDDQFVDFVLSALKESYTLPTEIWDALEIITLQDYDSIFAAGMGIPDEALQKKT